MSLIADTQQTPLKNESFMKAHLASTTLGSSTKIANLNESVRGKEGNSSLPRALQ